MNSRRQSRIIINIFAIVLIVLIAIAIALIILTRVDGGDARAEQDGGNVVENTSNEKWQEGNIEYNGKVYRYNPGIKTYLFLGIDKEGVPEEVVVDGISGGQSDAMFLLVTDSVNETVKVVAINRNTMTQVDVYDVEGDFLDTRELQICLQHGFGDGMQISCQRSAETVSRLFHDIPISGYLSLNMDGIGLLNDALGGVTLEVMDDIENEGLGVSLKAGETKTLNGNEAYVYIRSRDTGTFASANRRLERQQQYLVQMFAGLSDAAKSKTKILSVYNAVEDYLVANIDMVKLAEDLSDYTFDETNMYSVPGETVMGTQFEEYRVDEDAFYEMILELFYQEVTDQ